MRLWGSMSTLCEWPYMLTWTLNFLIHTRGWIQIILLTNMHMFQEMYTKCGLHNGNFHIILNSKDIVFYPIHISIWWWETLSHYFFHPKSIDQWTRCTKYRHVPIIQFAMTPISFCSSRFWWSSNPVIGERHRINSKPSMVCWMGCIFRSMPNRIPKACANNIIFRCKSLPERYLPKRTSQTVNNWVIHGKCHLLGLPHNRFGKRTFGNLHFSI